jgi:hypothetical protein
MMDTDKHALDNPATDFLNRFVQLPGLFLTATIAALRPAAKLARKFHRKNPAGYPVVDWTISPQTLTRLPA